MGCFDGFFINFKFLYLIFLIGVKVFDWLRRDDNDRVYSLCVFYGFVVIVGDLVLLFFYNWVKSNKCSSG